jgi:2-C-methyl-D-erythritol 4-phosphate cytidylyltransferase
VVLAAGSGTRVGSERNKVFLPLAGRHVVSWSFAWAALVPGVTRFLLVTRQEDLDLARTALAGDLPGTTVEVIRGGATRHASERAALDHLAPAIGGGEIDLVALHDGARPLAVPDLVTRVLAGAWRDGGAVPALPAEGLVPVDPTGQPVPADPAQRLVRVQTPQAFRARDLVAAYVAADTVGFVGTDTASTVERFSGLRVRVVPGSPLNIKITYPRDLPLTERVLAGVTGPVGPSPTGD